MLSVGDTEITAGVGGNQMPVLVINLDRSTRRMELQTKQARRLGIVIKRVPAIDGQAISEADYREYAFRWQRPLSRSEVGCLLSHVECWKRAVSEDRNLVVLEDDVILADEFKDILPIGKHIEGLSILNLETRADRRFVSDIETQINSKFDLMKLRLSVSGSAAYIITPQSAERLVNNLRRRASIADFYIWSHGEHRLLQCCPSTAVAIDILEYKYLNKNSINYRTTIAKLPMSLADKILLFFRHPKLRFRRGFGQLRLGFAKLLLSRKAMARTIDPCPSIFANYQTLMGDKHG